MGDVITLQPGELRPTSPCDYQRREVLLDLASAIRDAAALNSGAAAATHLRQGASHVEAAAESEFLHSWWQHLGAVPFLGLRYTTKQTVGGAGFIWIDELDAASDARLRAVPGIGRKRLAEIRTALSTYYWRGDPEASRVLWRGIAQRLRKELEYRYLQERDRVLDGIEFADRVLATDGACLSDPTAPRRIG